MKKKMILAAVMAAAMLLTACDKTEVSSSQGGDISSADVQTSDKAISQYKDFLDYTFNGNYKVAEPVQNVIRADTEFAQTITSRDITYYLKDGQEKVATYRTSEYANVDADYYKSEEIHDLSELDSFITLLMGDIAKNEFVEKIASKHLELEYDNIRGIYICPEIGNLSIFVYPPVFIGAYEDSNSEDFDKSCEIVKERMTVGSGYSVSESDLKSLCSNKDYVFTCQFVINKNLDKEKYAEIMENIMKDFEEYVGSPQNFNFFLAEDEYSEWIMRKMHLMGEEVPSDKIDSGEIVYADELKKSIFANH